MRFRTRPAWPQATRTRLFRRAAIACVVALLPAVGPAWAETASAETAATPDAVHDIELLPSGRVVSAGSNGSDPGYTLALWDSKGNLRGTELLRPGGIEINIGRVRVDSLNTVNGRERVVVVYSGSKDGVVWRMYAVAYTAGLNGFSIDPTFNQGRPATLPTPHTPDPKNATGIAVDSAGRLLVAGTDGSYAWVSRLTLSGALDVTFGGTGAVIAYAWTNSIDRDFGGLAVGSDDAPYIAVNTTSVDRSSHVVKLKSSGVHDETWSGDGVLDIPAPDGVPIEVTSLASDPTGKGVVLTGFRRPDGSPSPDCPVMRFTAAGEPDPTFGSVADNPGLAYWETGNSGCAATSLSVSSSSIRLFATKTDPSYERHGYIVAMTNVGAVDTPWGVSGVREFDDSNPSGYDCQLWDGELTPNGKVVAGGNYDDSPDKPSATVIARYSTTGSPDTTFSGDGYAVAGL